MARSERGYATVVRGRSPRGESNVKVSKLIVKGVQDYGEELVYENVDYNVNDAGVLTVVQTQTEGDVIQVETKHATHFRYWDTVIAEGFEMS
jgi:hypothetical protein